MCALFELSPPIELTIPSMLGSEKAAMEMAATIGEDMQFSQERREDIKTAVSEACINAIEHGNSLEQDERVRIVFRETRGSLEIDVVDQGPGFDLDRIPSAGSVRQRLQQANHSLRGWGLYLIRHVADSISSRTTTNGHTLTMVFYKPLHKEAI